MARLSTACGWLALVSACSGGDGTPPGGGGADAGSDPSREGLVPIVADCTVPPTPAPTEVNLALDVEYAQVGGVPLLLDVAWPLGGTTRPLVVMIHGGGWIVGDKSDARARDFILRLAAHGYAAASLNYRLTLDGNDPFPAAVEDVRCAVRWLRANGDSYGIDSSRVAAVGASAGAYLALMLGSAGDVNGLDGGCALTGPIDLAGAVSFYGPTDLRPGAAWSAGGAALVSNFLGSTPDELPELAEQASPIVHVDSADPPQLLIHGGADSLVLPDQSRRMQAAFEAVGVGSTYLELAEAPHSFDVVTDEPAYRASTCTTLAYLAQVLDGSP